MKKQYWGKKFTAVLLAAAMMMQNCAGVMASDNIIDAPPAAEEMAEMPIEMADVNEQIEETSAPETPAPETPAPETPAPETPAPETPAPETPAPETPAPETPAPETPAPETPAPETPAPETSAPETEPAETSAPETEPAETSAPETETPETSAPETEPVVTVPETEETDAAETQDASGSQEASGDMLPGDETSVDGTDGGDTESETVLTETEETEQTETTEETEAQTEEKPYTAQVANTPVQIKVQSGGVLPEGCALTAKAAEPEKADGIAQSIAAKLHEEEKTLLDIEAFDISVFNESGEALHQLDGNVLVEIEGLTVPEEAEQIYVYHAAEELEQVKVLAKEDLADGVLRFETDHFSIYAVAYVKSEDLNAGIATIASNVETVTITYVAQLLDGNPGGGTFEGATSQKVDLGAQYDKKSNEWINNPVNKLMDVTAKEDSNHYFVRWVVYNKDGTPSQVTGNAGLTVANVAKKQKQIDNEGDQYEFTRDMTFVALFAPKVKIKFEVDNRQYENDTTKAEGGITSYSYEIKTAVKKDITISKAEKGKSVFKGWKFKDAPDDQEYISTKAELTYSALYKAVKDTEFVLATSYQDPITEALTVVAVFEPTGHIGFNLINSCNMFDKTKLGDKVKLLIPDNHSAGGGQKYVYIGKQYEKDASITVESEFEPYCNAGEGEIHHTFVGWYDKKQEEGNSITYSGYILQPGETNPNAKYNRSTSTQTLDAIWYYIDVEPIAEYYYTGQPHKPEPELKNSVEPKYLDDIKKAVIEEGTIHSKEKIDGEVKDKEIGAGIVNAGDHIVEHSTYVVAGSKRSDVTQTSHINIKKRTIDINVTKTVTYNGSEQELEITAGDYNIIYDPSNPGITSDDGKGLIKGQTLTISNAKATGTDPGTYTFTGTAANYDITSAGESVKDNYTVNIKATLIIEPTITYELNAEPEAETSNEGNPTKYTPGAEFEFHQPQYGVKPEGSSDTKYYTFAGWYSDTDLTQVRTGIKTTDKDNITVYAKWKAVGKVCYDLNASDASWAPGAGITVSGDTTIYTDDTQDYTDGNTHGLTGTTRVTLPTAVPTRTGYTFAGWKDNKAAFNSGTVIKSGSADYPLAGKYDKTTGEPDTLTLTAQWTPNTYTVTFDENGGTGDKEPQTFQYGTSGSLNQKADGGLYAEFTRTGYTFAGWAKTNGATAAEYYDGDTVLNGSINGMSAWPAVGVDGTSQLTLYAVWTPNEYTITFHANTGTGSDATQTQTFTYGTPGSLNKNADGQPVASFTKTGYTFVGWAKTDSAKAADYLDGVNVSPWSIGGTEVSEWKSAVDGDLDLYAVWTPDFSGIQVNGFQVEYDGQIHSFSVTGTLDGDTVKFYKKTSAAGAAETWEEITTGVTFAEDHKSFTIKDVENSISEVKAVVTRGTDSYGNNGELTRPAIITPKAVTLTSATDSKPYDGTPLTNTEVTITGSFVAEEGFATCTAIGSRTLVGECENSIAYTLKENTKASNYTITEVKGTLTVTDRTSKYEVTVTAGSDTVTYDGEEHTVTTIAKATYNGTDYPAQAGQPLQFTIMVDGTEVTYTIENLTASGSGTDVQDGGYDINITSTPVIKDKGGNDVTDQFTVSKVSGKLTINKRAVTLTSATDSKSYDGQPLTNTEVTIGGDGFVKDEGVTCSVTGSQTLVGSSNNVFTYQMKNGTKESNYTITKIEGTLTVTDNSVNSSDVVTKTHSGSGAYHVGDTVEFTITVKNIYDTPKTITVTEKENVTFIDESTAGVTISGHTATLESVNPGDEVTLKASYVITAADISAASYENTVTVEFADGKTFTAADTVPTTDQQTYIVKHIWVDSDSNEIVLQEDAPENAAYGATITGADHTATIEGFTYASAENLTVGAENEENIVKVYYTPNFTVSGYNKKYDGQEHGVTVGGTLSGDEVKYYVVTGSGKTEINNSFKDAGSTTVTVEITRRGGVYRTTAQVNITKRAVTLTADSASKTYDGKPLTKDTFTAGGADGFVSGEGVTCTVTGSQTLAGSSDNTITDYKPIDGTNLNNYTITTEKGKLTINKRKVTLTSGSAQKDYDGTPLTNHDVTVGGDGFADGEGADYTVTGSQRYVGTSSNSFTYQLKAGTLASNYEISTVEGTLEIVSHPDHYQIQVKANSGEWTYDGKSHTVSGFETLTFTINGQTYTVSGITSELTGKDVCNDTIAITGTPIVKDAAGVDVTSQFAVSTVQGTLTINKRKVELTSGTASKKYDGTELTNHDVKVGEEGFVNGEGSGVAYQFTGSQRYVGSSQNLFAVDSEHSTTNLRNYDIQYEYGALTVTDGTEGDPVDPDDVVVKSHEGDHFTTGQVVEFTITVTNLYNEPKTITIREKDGVTIVGQSVFNNVQPGAVVTAKAQYTVKDEDRPNIFFLNQVWADFSGGKTFTNTDVVEMEHPTIGVNDINQYYDGQTHQLEVTGTKPENDTIEYYVIQADGSRKQVENSFKDVVNERVLVLVKHKGELVDESGVIAYVNIMPRTVNLESASLEKTYDGTVLENGDTALVKDGQTYGQDGSGFVPGEGLQITFTGGQRLVGSSENSFSYDFQAGTDKNNYVVTTKFGTLTVKDAPTAEGEEPVDPKLVVVKSHDGKDFRVGDIITFNIKATNIYKEKKTITFTEQPGVMISGGQTSFEVEPGESVTVQAVYRVTEADAALGSFRNEVTVTFSGEDQPFTAEDTVTDLVKPELTIKEVTKKYDGRNVQVEIGGLLPGDEVYYYLYDAAGKRQDVTNSLKDVKQSTKDLRVEVKRGAEVHELRTSVTILPRDITLASGSGEKTYDGQPLTNKEVTMTGDGFAPGEKIAFEATGSQTNAGTCDNVIAYQAEGAADLNNYRIVTQPGTLTVNKRRVVLTSGSATKEYDGRKLTNSTVKAGGDGFVSGEGAVYTVTGEQLYVGESKNDFTYQLKEGTLASNYEISKAEGTLKVENLQSRYQIKVEANSGETTYDGTLHEISGFKTLTFTVNGLTYTVEGLTSERQEMMDAGEYDVPVTGRAKVLDAAGMDVTSQFAVELVPGTYTIHRCPITLQSDSLTKKYDGEPLKNETHLLLQGMDGWKGRDGALYEFTGEQTYVGSSENTFEIVPMGKTKLSNYDITILYGTLTVTDGTEGDPVVPDDVVVKSHAGGPFEEGQVIEFTITVTNIYDEEKTITLREKDGVTIVGQSVFEDVQPGASVTATAQYTVKEADLAEGIFANRVWAQFSGGKTFTNTDIARMAHPRMDVEDINRCYDGTVSELEVTGMQPNETAEYYVLNEDDSWTKIDNFFKNVTDQQVIVQVKDAKGDVIYTGSANVKITPRTVYLESASLEKVYDGAELANWETPLAKDGTGFEADGAGTGVVSGEEIYIQEFTGQQTLVGSSANSFRYEFGDDTDKNNYAVTTKFGTLTVKDAPTAAGEEPVDPKLVVVKNHDGQEFRIGDVITFRIKATNIYQEKKTITFEEQPGVMILGGQTSFEVEPGESVTVEAVYKVTAADVAAKSFKNQVTVTFDGEDQPFTAEDTADSFVEPELTAKEVTKEYDGGNVEVEIEGLQPGDEVHYYIYDEQGRRQDVTDSLKDVKQSTDDLLIEVKRGDETYDLHTSVAITPREVTFTSASAEKTYDGQPLTDGAVTVGGDGFAPGEGAAAEATGSQTLVGSSENDLTYQFNDGTDPDNYHVTVEKGVLTVKDAPTAEGEKPVDPKLVVTKSHNGQEYRLGDTITFDIEATNIYEEKKTITFEEQPGVMILGGQTSFEVEPGESVKVQASYTVTEADIAAGSFKNQVTVTFSGEDQPFTAEDMVTGFVVVPNQGPELHAKEVTKEYDGRNVEVEIEGLQPGDEVHYYIYDEQGGRQDVTDSLKDVKQSTDDLVIEVKRGDETYELHTSVTIVPREVTVKSGAGEKVYDGQPLTNDEVTISGDGFADGEGMTAKAAGSQTLVGSSENDVTYQFNDGTDPDNYHVTVEKGVLTVKDAPTAEGEKPVDPKLVVTKSHSGGTYTVGDQITFSISATNIYDTPMTVTITEQAGVTITGQSVFENVAPGASVSATAVYTVTEADGEAGTFKNVAAAAFAGPDGETHTYRGEDTAATQKKPVAYSITLTKRVRDVNDHRIALIGATFYVALFADEGLTKLASDVKAVKFTGGAAEESVTFDGLQGSAYYAAEVNAEGAAVVSGQFGGGSFVPSYAGNNHMIQLSESQPTAQFNIDNIFLELPEEQYYRDLTEPEPERQTETEPETESEEETTEYETETENGTETESESETKAAGSGSSPASSEPVKTGDDTPIATMLLLLAASGLTAGILERKRRRSR